LINNKKQNKKSITFLKRHSEARSRKHKDAENARRRSIPENRKKEKTVLSDPSPITIFKIQIYTMVIKTSLSSTAKFDAEIAILNLSFQECK
jgi:hypothetical protein